MKLLLHKSALLCTFQLFLCILFGYILKKNYLCARLKKGHQYLHIINIIWL
ncbi:hypothetical protein SAMN04487827_2397 [Prevotella sp. khp7]|nr:hypothetical protein SAMN04487827_2397 [Prevotella sp. khp7]